jgi:hypothetical protein
MARIPTPNYPPVPRLVPKVGDRPIAEEGGGIPSGREALTARFDEAKVHKADNDLVEDWQRLSEGYFGSTDEAAATGRQAIGQALDDRVRARREMLGNERQRGMFDPVASLRRGMWLERIAAHADHATRAFNETESLRRQALATDDLTATAGRGDERRIAESTARLLGEVRGRSGRFGLDAKGASLAEAQALTDTHTRVVEQIAGSDPMRAQAWLDAHRAQINNAATLEWLDRTLRPFVEAQQADGIADGIRSKAGALDAQITQVDTLGLGPEMNALVKQGLVLRARQDAAALHEA